MCNSCARSRASDRRIRHNALYLFGLWWVCVLLVLCATDFLCLERKCSMASKLSTRGEGREIQPKSPDEKLSDASKCLSQDTVFKVIKELVEIQKLTENHLLKEKMLLLKRQQKEMRDVLQNITNEHIRKQRQNLLKMKHYVDVQTTDLKTVLKLDQMVQYQQVTLQRLGIPGFFVTKKPNEINLQSHIMHFLLQLLEKRPNS